MGGKEMVGATREKMMMMMGDVGGGMIDIDLSAIATMIDASVEAHPAMPTSMSIKISQDARQHHMNSATCLLLPNTTNERRLHRHASSTTSFTTTHQSFEFVTTNRHQHSLEVRLHNHQFHRLDRAPDLHNHPRSE